MKNGTVFALIVAAGRGARAGAGGPKQYRPLAGKAVLARTVTAFLDHDEIDAVRVVIHRDDHDLYTDAMAKIAQHRKLLPPVNGGAERQDSVRIGLESFEQATGDSAASPPRNGPSSHQSQQPDKVLIHDAARPFVDHATIARVIAALQASDGAIAALPVFDTIKRAGDHTHGAAPNIETTIPRDDLWRAQTPQGFHFTGILDAHREAIGRILTDDAAVAEAEGLSVQLVAGSPDNMKITQAEDFGMAEILLGRKAVMSAPSQSYEFRTGHGFDVHEFEHGDAAILCGVAVPHDQKLKGHSDADAGMHALTDAILGALSAGDIGDHFPPTDPQWKGAPSRVFLEKARRLVDDANGVITHCDVTLMCEAPKIKPHRAAMREALAEILNLSVDRISVKATTTEQLGFTGRREGLAALATATIRLPFDEPAE